MRISIEKLVYGGEGLAREQGQVILAPFVLPAESVEVELSESRSGFSRARLLEVVSPSPNRVEAPCPYFRRCGGCHYQHGSYEAQLAAKREILAEVLRRVGKLEPPGEIPVISAEPWGYRNRTQFHVTGSSLGFLGWRSHRLCPVDHCPISSPGVNQALAALLEMAREPRWPRFLRQIELFSNESQSWVNVAEASQPVARRFFDWCAERIPGAGELALDYPAAGFTFLVSNRSFFQVNRFLVDRLVEEALWQAQGETALDLYAGVGFFTLPLSARFRNVTAVETGAAAVRDLRHNAERAGLAPSIAAQSVEPFLASLERAPDFVLADPPRAGLDKAVVARLIELRPPRITIVACDPATMARDAARLVASGYRFERLAMVDLFPQTYHVESVAHLRLP